MSCKSHLFRRYESMSSIITPDWNKHETGIYFVLAPDVNRVKIGKSKNLPNRLTALKTGSPVELELVAYFLGPHDAEPFIHKVFHKYRLHGEWFSYGYTIKRVVKRLNTLKNASFMDCLPEPMHKQYDFDGYAQPDSNVTTMMFDNRVIYT